MDAALLRLHWPVLRGKLQQRFGSFAEPNPGPTAGREDQFLAELARSLRQTQAALEGFLDTAVAEMLRGGNLPLTAMENEERLGNPRGTRDLPPGAESAAMTPPPDDGAGNRSR